MAFFFGKSLKHWTLNLCVRTLLPWIQSPAQALALMEQILEKDPLNALGLYGRARSLDSLAEVERSNARLEQSIFAYRAVLDLEDQVDDQLYLKAALRCIDRMRFKGN